MVRITPSVKRGRRVPPIDASTLLDLVRDITVALEAGPPGSEERNVLLDLLHETVMCFVGTQLGICEDNMHAVWSAYRVDAVPWPGRALKA